MGSRGQKGPKKGGVSVYVTRSVKKNPVKKGRRDSDKAYVILITKKGRASLSIRLQEIIKPRAHSASSGEGLKIPCKGYKRLSSPTSELSQTRVLEKRRNRIEDESYTPHWAGDAIGPVIVPENQVRGKERRDSYS